MTSATTPKTIELWGSGGIQNEATVTNAAVTPGHLLTRTATGVRPHNVAGGPATASFAVENGAVGRGISDTYAVGDQCIFKEFMPGAAVYALVAAGAAAIAQNALLQSAGDGTLSTASTNDVAVARALEAVDNSGGASVARIKVEIIPAQRTSAT